MIKMIIGLCVTTALFFMSLDYAYSGEYHHAIMPSNGVNNYQSANGVALGIAVAHATQFDFSTFDLQGGIGVGGYGDIKATSFALGKRFNRAMINGSISAEEGANKFGFGAGIRWNF